jgi:hypothetical protein
VGGLLRGRPAAVPACLSLLVLGERINAYLLLEEEAFYPRNLPIKKGTLSRTRILLIKVLIRVLFIK